jgi:MarR family transcriptional regulator, organic hydroperoxide resistance regulator
MDYARSGGPAALGARLRRLSEAVDRDATRAYLELGIQFEQRWFGVINQLALNETATVGQLASSLGITHASVSQTRKSLESAGLVRSKANPSDGRSSQIRLTRKGRALVDQLTPLWAAMDAAAIEVDTEAGGVVEKLDQLDDALSRQGLFDRIMIHSSL